MLIQIKHRYSGQVLFEYDVDDNTAKITLAEAVRLGADLTEQKLLIASTRIIPPIGQEIIGYKKCCNGIIVKLLIPKEAKRSHAFDRKCRAEYATVLEIDGAEIAYSQHDNNFSYKVG